MLEHFRETGEGSLGARRICSKQEGSYNDYVKKFLNYSAPLLEKAKSVLMDAFLIGLEPTQQVEVVSRHPKTWEECRVTSRKLHFALTKGIMNSLLCRLVWPMPKPLMNQVFQLFPTICIGVFYLHILVYRTDITEHERHLRVMFNILKDNKLFANRKKCVIGHSRIPYLGHWISSKGVEADGEKIKAMVNWPQPKDVSTLQRFIGLTRCYRRFVKGYGTLHHHSLNSYRKCN